MTYFFLSLYCILDVEKVKAQTKKVNKIPALLLSSVWTSRKQIQPASKWIVTIISSQGQLCHCKLSQQPPLLSDVSFTYSPWNLIFKNRRLSEIFQFKVISGRTSIPLWPGRSTKGVLWQKQPWWPNQAQGLRGGFRNTTFHINFAVSKEMRLRVRFTVLTWCWPFYSQSCLALSPSKHCFIYNEIPLYTY